MKKQLMSDLMEFGKCKWYLLSLAMTGLLAYGFAVTHYAIGMDDTAVSLYYEEGLAPYVGRWSLFLINKFFHISDFAPWLVEFISVLIFMLSVTFWCILWKKICEPAVILPLWKYGLIAGMFLSCPLISEVFVFYLHNGICMGYGVIALALIFFVQGMRVDQTGKRCIKNVMISSVLLTFAIGFYESFIIVYIMGAILCYLLVRCLYGKKGKRYRDNIFEWTVKGGAAVLVSVGFRQMILLSLKAIYHLDRFSVYDVLYRSLFGNSFKVEGELAMIIKRFLVKYYVNAIAYFPVTVLAISFLLLVGYLFWKGIKRHDYLLPFCGIVLIALPLVMSIIEGMATRYRSAQYVPVICAFAVLILMIETQQSKFSRMLTAISGLVVSILIFNQCAEMNSWFYRDYLKYEDTKEVMSNVAYDLEQNFDYSKPIVFRGAYTVPYAITEKAYLSFNSEEYRMVCKLTDPIDPHLKEKYFDNNVGAYVLAESPVVSTLQWGVTAFDGTSQQLIEFWKMHGIDSFRCVTDLEMIEEAEQIRSAEQMPGYPKEGYIKETDEYIIVNLSDTE